ncbi:MAG TPA: MarR family winged helix-turn-helix transcriptional regulator [Steroidobacteraceae bacterium]|nr:MarR family winged helix-turn-helix transcriptional regulator [Steroidobacteraceae bacterium]
MTIPRGMNPTDADFNLFNSLFYLIAHADFHYHEDLDKVMAKVGVDRTTYRLFSVMHQIGPANIKVICRHALVKRSTGGRAIERMRDNGWVTTSLNKIDQREIDVELTAAGKRVTRELKEVTGRQLLRATTGFTAAELKELAGMLERIGRNLSRLPIE